MESKEKYQINEDMVLADLDDEVVALSVMDGNYLTFGPVGSRIISLVQKGTSLTDIIKELQNEFDIDEATCRRDVLEFIEESKQLHVISSPVSKQTNHKVP
ncbi:MAG: Coenzyme synthesis protein (PqqD) [Candidatus Brocadiaceae bacterium]|nr:Coenzyme synthesis protein (PqqD) [Candidatus Brocadiaceae bacterium]MBM2834352.1 Coenzyme synthesis protein (PqqD) [Candidatus Brocadiaceae bacterium]